MDETILNSQVAVVAGGGRGIGEAVSRALGAAGAIVAVLDLEPDRGTAVRDAIAAAGGRAASYRVDLLESEEVDSTMQAIESEYGRIDVLVNVAGGMVMYAAMKPLHEWSDEELDRVVGINLSYVFRTCRAVLPSMVAAGGGSIVNIASTAAFQSAPRMAPYGAAKVAVVSLTQSLAVEYGVHGIRVNAVAPGHTATPAAASKGGANSATKERIAQAIPLRRRGTPEGIAEAVVFLASPRADYVTGQTLAVDGGASNLPAHIAALSG